MEFLVVYADGDSVLIKTEADSNDYIECSHDYHQPGTICDFIHTAGKLTTIRLVFKKFNSQKW